MKESKRILKIMTYNIHSGKDLKGENTFLEMIDFVKENNPDVLALQEVNENKKRGYQISQLIKHFSEIYHFGPHVKISNGYYGIATFSKFPIVTRKHILLPSFKEQRGVLHTTLKIDDKNIDIFNTHLGLNAKERKQQISFIQESLRNVKNSFVLMGDFNDNKPILDSCLLYDTSIWNNQESIPTLIKFHKKVDFIFVSNDITTVDYEVSPIILSDHYPIIAKMKI